MRYERRQDQENIHAALQHETKEKVDNGLARDVTRELLRQKTEHSNVMQVQIPKGQQEALAETLKKLVEDPSSVYVTDVTGKHIVVHKGVTHEDLAELVCKRGHRLHVLPKISMNEAATELAVATNGSVLVPGKEPMTHDGVVKLLEQAVETGNKETLQDIVNVLRSRKNNGSPLEVDSYGFLASITGDLEKDLGQEKDGRQLIKASWYEFDCLHERWASIRKSDLEEQLQNMYSSNNVLEIIPEIPPPVSMKRQRIIIESNIDNDATPTVEADNQQGEVNDGTSSIEAGNQGQVSTLSNEQFEELVTAKIQHMEASHALDEDPDNQDRQNAYEKAYQQLDAIDGDHVLTKKMDADQIMTLFKRTMIVSRAIVDRQEQIKPQQNDATLASWAGMSVAEIIGRDDQ